MLMRFGGISALVSAMSAVILAFAVPAAATESRTFDYDALGRMVGQVSDGTVNDNNSRTYCYDQAGNRTRVDANQSGALSTATCPASVYTTSNLWVEDVTVTEGIVLAFTITRSGNTTGVVSASYATSNGSATAPGDYTGISGSVTFAAGETTKTISVASIEDALFEQDETVTMALSSPVGAALVDGVGTGTITDNDAALAIYLTVADAEAVEGSPINFVVARTGNTSVSSTVNYYTTDYTAFSYVGPDYANTSGTLAFAAGETSKIVSVVTGNDSENEYFESFYLILDNPSVNSIINDSAGLGTIIDNDLTALLSVSDAIVTEGGALSFVVSRTGYTTIAVTAEYETLNGSAVAPGDYATTAGTVSFASGQTSATVVVPTIDDSAIEGTESLTLWMPYRSMGAHILDESGAGTILDNDASPATLTIADATVTEGGTLSFTVTRGGNTAIAASAIYTTSNGTAIAPGDYASASGTVSFAAGETSKTILVATIDDAAVESAEGLTVTLSGPSANVTISDGSGAGTINDNDVVGLMPLTDTSYWPFVGNVLPAHASAYFCVRGFEPTGDEYQVCYTTGGVPVFDAYTYAGPFFANGYSRSASGVLQVAPGNYGQ
jgi:Calx-beta domain